MENWKADILMVDDEPGNLLALEASLEPLGQNLLRAQSGQEALRLVLRHDLAVILLDVRMPGMDGFETARMIRLRERSRHTPIIFLTGVHKLAIKDTLSPRRDTYPPSNDDTMCVAAHITLSHPDQARRRRSRDRLQIATTH